MQVITYHGTDENFNKFSFEKMGQSNGLDAGFGLYFTTDRVDAFTYGDLVYECRLELKRNVDNHKVTFTETQLKAILDSVKENPSNSNPYKYYGVAPQENLGKTSDNGHKFLNVNKHDEIVRRMLKEFKSDTKIIASLIKNFYNGICDEMCGIFVKYGFTHTNDLDTLESVLIHHYILYYLNAINIIKIEDLNTL